MALVNISLLPLACSRPAPKLPNGVGINRITPLTCRRSTRTLTVVRNNFASSDGDVADDSLRPSRMLSRDSFPPGFCFGASSSAYQIEGGANEGGKGASIWDTFCKTSDKVADKSNGDVAVDSYHRYKEDVELLSDMGMNAYRFSIAWSRILPTGSLDGGINKEGINYYNNLINELIKHGIKPFVTLFHWDLPQALQDKYKGFLDRKIVDDFKDYAEICFKEFGDRVKHWTTLNEPEVYSNIGHGYGWHAPGRCSPYFGCPVPEGDSLKEPYTVSHNLILAHATAAQLYKDKYQASQGGEIGISLSCTGYKPYDQLHYNNQAEERALDFQIGWYMDPLVFGDYPFSMRALVRDRLPYFNADESEIIKGSFNFIGLNYYTGRYVLQRQISSDFQPNVSRLESHTCELEVKNGIPIGNKVKGTYVYPKGLNKLLHYAKRRYNNPQIYITENGIPEDNLPDLTIEEACNDMYRQNFLLLHLEETRKAISDGVNVKGHFTWSLVDSFEWHNGYTQRYGLVYVDYKDNLKRIPKASSKWYANFLKGTEPLIARKAAV